MTLTFVIFLMACYGMTNVITGSKLLESIRNWIENKNELLGYFFKCPMCIGFWVGIAFCFAGIFPLHVGTGKSGDLLTVFIAGQVASGWCWVWRVIMHYYGEDEL